MWQNFFKSGYVHLLPPPPTHTHPFLPPIQIFIAFFSHFGAPCSLVTWNDVVLYCVVAEEAA